MATEDSERRIDPLDGVAYTRGELFAFYKKQKYAKSGIESYWQGLTPVNSLGEKRIDPVNGVAYTFEELSLFYTGTYKKKDIKSYWAACKVVKPKKEKKKTKKDNGAATDEATEKGEEVAKVKKKELAPQRDAHFEGFTLEQLGLHTVQRGRDGFEEAEARAHQGFQYELERSWGTDYHLNFSVHDVIERFLEKRCAEKSFASFLNGDSPLEVKTVVISHPNANFGETLDCIKAAMTLYGTPEPLYMKMFSQAHGEEARLYRKHRPPTLTKLLREGGVQEVIVLHPDIPPPFNIFDKSWMVYDVMTAIEVGCAVRHVGLPRVLREVQEHIDVSGAMHGPKRKGSKAPDGKDPFRAPIEEFGVERLNQHIKDGIRQTLEGFRDHSVQKVDGRSFGPAHWAMTLKQLLALRDEIRASFPDTYPDLTMRDVVDKVVIPQTQGTGLGWALLQNKESPLPPEYLISHAWDETFDEMVEALLGAGLTEDQRIWVCALALYQPNDGDGPSISDQLGLDVKEGPFAQILHMPDLKGMVAVHTAKCDLYSRLWCDYEFLEAVQSGVNVIFAGDEKVIQQQGKIDSRTATCGAPSEFMVEDTRKIRRIIEQTWGSRLVSTPTSRGSRKFPSGSEAYEILNQKIFQFREKCKR